MPAPMMSVAALRQGLRWPTGQDLLFSIKTTAAVVISLAIGFSQNLENPYWSALTIYVLVAQPQTGAIRSKALFRLGGTILGGALTVATAAVFASNVGLLLVTFLTLIVVTLWMKLLDRTPANHLWFATSVTILVIGVIHVQSPDTIWTFTVNRLAEMMLAILSIGLIDSLLLPHRMTPAFIDAMSSWRDEARDWALAALAADTQLDAGVLQGYRKGLHAIAAKAAPLDAQGVQLPWDVVASPPSARTVRLLRLLVARIMAELASTAVWLEQSRPVRTHSDLLAEARAWLEQQPAIEADPVAAHVQSGGRLIKALDEAGVAAGHDATEHTLMWTTSLLQVRELISDWSAMEQVLLAAASGKTLPPDLARAAARARPRRSVDYLAAAIDTLPLVLGFALVTIIWFWTTWTGATTALVFVYVASAFILGTPGAVASGRGEMLWLSTSLSLTFLYQFAVLPRVTAFPVLVAVLSCALVPLGMVMAMAPPGLMVAATFFGFLGLQNAYAADFANSLQTLGGALTGCALAIGLLHFCRYDDVRFKARRLARAMWRDVAEVADVHHVPKRDDYRSLGMDRWSLYLQITGDLPEDDPLLQSRLFACYQIGANLLALRDCQSDLSAETEAVIRTLRNAIAGPARNGVPPAAAIILPMLENVIGTIHEHEVRSARARPLIALIGLQLAFEATSRRSGQ